MFFINFIKIPVFDNSTNFVFQLEYLNCPNHDVIYSYTHNKCKLSDGKWSNFEVKIFVLLEILKKLEKLLI